MSAILISQKLKQRIFNHIERTYKDQIAETEKQLEKYNVADLCYETYIPVGYRRMAVQLNLDPNGSWVPTYSHAYIIVTYTDNNGYEGCKHYFKSNFVRYANAPVPIRFKGINDLIHFELKNTLPCYNEVVKICREITDIQIESQTTIAALANFIEECKYLHHLMTVWPDVMRILPDSLCTTYRFQGQPNSKKAGAIELPDQLKTAFFKLKLLGKL